jgi:hypothetical protein
MTTATNSAPSYTEPRPEKPPASPEQVALWSAWAEALVACEAARAALGRFADLLEETPDTPHDDHFDIHIDNAERAEGANAIAWGLRFGMDGMVGADLPNEVEYLAGRYEARDRTGQRNGDVTEYAHALLRERMARRVGAA